MFKKIFATLIYFIYLCKVKKYIWIIFVAITGCFIILFSIMSNHKSKWAKQTLYVKIINCFHKQSKDARARILLIDDDCGEGIYTIKEICDKLGMKASFAVIPEKMSTKKCDSLKQWQQQGYGIAIHGYNHKDWREWDYKEVMNDIIKCERWLSDKGFKSKEIKIVVPPHGGNSRAIRRAINDKGYQMISGARIMNPDTEVFQFGRIMVTKNTDMKEMKLMMQEAKEKKLFVIIGTHSSMSDEFSKEKTKAILQMAINMGFEYQH